MTIATVLLNSKAFARRKSWRSIFLSQCNKSLYVHSGPNDPLGREWHPNVDDLTAKDWEIVK